jgi:RNA polymerase sigma factor (sigma-70 family)
LAIRPELHLFDHEVSDLAPQLAEFHSQSFGWALACCGRNHEQASDTLQQAYFKVLAGKVAYAGHAALRTWFFGVIRLTALETQRFSLSRWWWRASANEAEQHAVVDDAASPSQNLADREQAQLLSAALGKLAARQREVLHLVFYEELTLREASEIMGISVGTAAQHYERGKTKLHELLGTGARP